MGARPSSFRKSGGFLNGVDGVIAGYEFSDAFNGEPFKAGRDSKTKKERFHSLYCILSARIDGADEDTTTTLFVGGADDFEVSDDGHTLTPVEDGKELSGSTSFAKLISSLVEAGFPESLLSEDIIEYQSIIGTRVRFVQRTNVEDTKRLGKRKGKDGKEYDRQDLVIDQVYELPQTAKSAKNAKPATKGKATKAEPEDDDVADLSATALLAIVKAAGGTINKSKLSVKVVMNPVTKGHVLVNEVRSWLANDDNLETVDGVSYDRGTGIVSLEA